MINFPDSLTTNCSDSASLSQQPSYSPKPPRAIWDNIFEFPPNKDTLGGSAYLIVENEGNILIDCPAANEINQKFLQALGGVKQLFLTHRTAIGKTPEIQKTFNCEIIIQEQEAYLLPGLRVKTFQQELTLSDLTQVIWTPGHSPGSSCLYYAKNGGILFSGRHVVPNQLGEPVPLHTAKTFHWLRQIKSIQLLLNRFTPGTLEYICPGANIGFLRGKRAIAAAYQKLANLTVMSNED